jgi:hypothetical protein
MIDWAGAYILVLVFATQGQGGIAMQEFSNFKSCRAAIVQLESVENLTGYCIAKEIK